MKGLVIKKNANIFTVLFEEKKYDCIPRGKNKASGVFVGDYIEFSCENNQFFIEKVYSRKNCLVRPPVANIDQMLIVLSCTPKPDLVLIDKLILMCFLNGIEPVLCVNKIDISNDNFVSEIKNQYTSVLKIVFLSAKTKENIFLIKELLKGKISAFAGQSAVGKSALTNAILNKECTLVGELSKKIERGKNTTRLTELYEIEPNSFLIDTAGFTFLDEDLLLIEPEELWKFYPEFIDSSKNCKFGKCTHTNEDISVCGVKKATTEGIISTERYNRYKDLFLIIQKRWKSNYGKKA
ncbi:MAG: ribosome small subunit-dependent GTPase A [Clostridia bacterium]